MSEANPNAQPPSEDSFFDSLLREVADVKAKSIAEEQAIGERATVLTRERVEPPQPESPSQDEAQPAEPPASEAPSLEADAIADAEESTPAEPTLAEPAAASADEELPLTDDVNPFDDSKPKRRPAAKKPKTTAPRKSSRRNPQVEDLGDGSGYIAPALVAEEVAAVTDEDSGWYAVHCYSGQENKVKQNLEQRIETMGMAGRILKVVVPTEEEMEVKDGKRRTVERRVFPGYILVNMKMSEEAWFVVRNTPGVTRFAGMGNRPERLAQADVDQIIKRMEAEAPKLKVNYRPGQKVRITDGPFADFMGMVDKIDTERAKVSVLVSFFGRDTPVELDFLQVERM